MRIHNQYINKDYALNLLPLANTCNNISNMIKKRKSFSRQAAPYSPLTHYYSYIQSKSYGKMALLSIPIIGNFIAIYDLLSTNAKIKKRVNDFVANGSLSGLSEWERIEVLRHAIRRHDLNNNDIRTEYVQFIPLDMLALNEYGNIPWLLEIMEGLPPNRHCLNNHILNALTSEQRVHIVKQICYKHKISKIDGIRVLIWYLKDFGGEAKNDRNLFNYVFSISPVQALDYFSYEVLKEKTENKWFRNELLDEIKILKGQPKDVDETARVFKVIFRNDIEKKVKIFKKLKIWLVESEYTKEVIDKLILVDPRYQALTKIVKRKA